VTKEEERQDEEDEGRMAKYTVGKVRKKMADSEAGGDIEGGGGVERRERPL
jgi:hypothetical protein